MVDLCRSAAVLGLVSVCVACAPAPRPVDLSLAVGTENEQNVRELLKRGADPNAAWSPQGNTPLHDAAQNFRDNDSMVSLLLNAGAYVNARNADGQTPLHIAAAIGAQRIVATLIGRGASVDVRDRKGKTPLHVAAEKGQAGVVKALLAAGADAGIRDEKGVTPTQASFGSVKGILERAEMQAVQPASADPDAYRRIEDAIAAYERKDYPAALKIWTALAQQGHVRARYYLGLLHKDGNGVPQDHVEAAKWFRLAAEQGDLDSQSLLGFMLMRGQGIRQDEVEAVKWFTKAAEQGHMPATFNLGYMYDHRPNSANRTVPQDFVQSHKWYNLATKDELLGRKAMIARDAVAWRMTPEQIAQAQRLATEFRKSPAVAAAAPSGDASGQGTTYSPLTSPQDRLDYARAMSDFLRAKVDADNSVNLGEENLYRGRMNEVRGNIIKGLKSTNVREAFRIEADKEIERGVIGIRNLANRNEVGTSKAAKAGSSMPKVVSHASPPTIVMPLSLSAASQFAQIEGKIVGGGKVVALTIDGTDAPVNPDGSFSFRRQVMVGENELRLVARDEWGQSAEAVLRVSRSVTPDIAPSFAQLDPLKAKGRPRPNAVALVIGIDGYQNAPPAEFAENDARRFYDYATTALGVPRDRVRLLTGAEARRLDIQKALLTWLKPLVVKGKTDVFVFFAGHGLASDDGINLFLLPYDGDRSLLAESAVRRKDVIDAAVEAGAASTTLFLDTCYSGGTRGKDTLMASARPVMLVAKEEGVPTGVTILAAAANDQLSSALGPARHGLFSYFLMKGLEGEAASDGRSITAADLESYLAGKVPAEAAKQGRKQTPQLVGDGSKVIATW